MHTYADGDDGFYPDYVEALSIVKALSMHRQLGLSLPELNSGNPENLLAIVAWFAGVHSTLRERVGKRQTESFLGHKANEYLSRFQKTPIYEFAHREFDRVQTLINELRELIANSKLLSDAHRRRLLVRLEAMQRELHLKSTDIDRFWGFIAEAGIAVRKFGEDMKPITERVDELGRIVIGVILSTEGIKALPEIGKLLLHH